MRGLRELEALQGSHGLKDCNSHFCTIPIWEERLRRRMPRRRQLPGLPGPGAQGPRDGRKTAPKEKASKEEAFGEEGSKEEASEEAFSQAPGSWCPGPPGRPENGTFDQVNKVVDVAHGVLASAPGSAGGACRCPSSFWTRKWTLQLEDAGGCGLLGLLRAAVRRGLSIRRRGRVHERLVFLSFVHERLALLSFCFPCVPASRCGVL